MRFRLSALDVVALLLSLTLAIPIASVCLSLFSGQSTVFVHLAQTVLPEYVANTLMLTALVVIGVLIVGVPAAWLTACCEFPGRRVLEAALILPLAAPAYVLAYAYAGFLSAYGPVQGALRSVTGWETGDYWFPDVRSLPGAALMLTLTLYPYVYLLARARFLNESASAVESARLLGRGPLGVVLRGVAAAGAAGAGGRRHARRDECTLRLRHRLLFRRAGVHHRHLQRVVFVLRSDGRARTGRGSDCVRRACVAGGAVFARAGAFPRNRAARPATGARAALGREIGRRDPRLHRAAGSGFRRAGAGAGRIVDRIGRTHARFLAPSVQHADAGRRRRSDRHLGRAILAFARKEGRKALPAAPRHSRASVMRCPVR